MSESITAQEGVLRELRLQIASGKLKPGQQVIQDSLAASLGVSRVPLREALKVLEGEGQVTYHPHRGYFVADLSVADLVEVYRIRSILEDFYMSRRQFTCRLRLYQCLPVPIVLSGRRHLPRCARCTSTVELSLQDTGVRNQAN